MGLYINQTSSGAQLPAKGKADFLLNNEPNTISLGNRPTEYRPNLVCVVDNGMFEAAAYCYSESEFNEFSRPDGRPRQWLIVPTAEKIAS